MVIPMLKSWLYSHLGAGHDAAGEFSIDRKFKNQRPEDTEQVGIRPLFRVDGNTRLIHRWIAGNSSFNSQGRAKRC